MTGGGGAGHYCPGQPIYLSVELLLLVLELLLCLINDDEDEMEGCLGNTAMSTTAHTVYSLDNEDKRSF